MTTASSVADVAAKTEPYEANDHSGQSTHDNAQFSGFNYQHYAQSASYQPNNSLSSMVSPQMQEALVVHQQQIKSHPLFGLLVLALEKCELATCTPRDVRKSEQDKLHPENDVCSSASFAADIRHFVQQCRTEPRVRNYVPSEELDQLMVQSIEVLRFHLLELEKVHELCDNFCHRYISCLKGKMPLDLVQDDRASSAGPSSDITSSPSVPPQSMPPNDYSQHQLDMSQYSMAPTYDMSMHQNQLMASQYAPLPATHLPAHLSQLQQHTSTGHPLSRAAGANDNGNQDHQDVKFECKAPLPPPIQQGTLHTVYQERQLTPNHNHRTSSTPHSSIGNESSATSPPHGVNAIHNLSNGSATPGMGAALTNLDCISDNGDMDSISGDSLTSGDLGERRLNGAGRKVPKVFSKEAITKLRAWLFANLSHPYPTEDQKKELATNTGLTILQVNNWFINARRRIVQPMIDQSNRAGRSPVVNVFKNRRRKNSGGASPEASPGAQNYSPNDANMQANMAVAAMAYQQSQQDMYRSMYNPYQQSMLNQSMLFGHAATPHMHFVHTPYNAPSAGWPDLSSAALAAASMNSTDQQ